MQEMEKNENKKKQNKEKSEKFFNFYGCFVFVLGSFFVAEGWKVLLADKEIVSNFHCGVKDSMNGLEKFNLIVVIFSLNSSASFLKY